MSVDKEITEDTGSGYGTTAVGERPARAARGVSAPSRPERTVPSRPGKTVRRPAAPRPARRGAATRPAAGGGLAEGARRAPVPRSAPRAPFVLLVVGLLCGGLVSLLLLNLVLAQDSFRANDLRKSTELLHQQAQDKKTEVMVKDQPGALDQRVKGDDSGMKPDKTAPEVLEVSKGPGASGSGQANTANTADAAGAEAQASQAEVARP
ncbi:hypothetical protein ACOZ38_30895 [Sphaerisporangium viridialbum]|uniref:hypothetical protein n=1 Tax=Sphaerisporangium viridialbum TaxID=46189 RepID=UPI003C780FE5